MNNKVETVSLGERLRLLQESNSPGLLHGTFLEHHPFSIEIVEEVFSDEPEMATFLQASMTRDRSTKRLSLRKKIPQGNPVSKWSTERRQKALDHRQNLIMSLLPLTLRVVYDHTNPNYWTLQKRGGNFDFICEYISEVMILHVSLFSNFVWRPDIDHQQNVNRFIAYARGSLHPQTIINAISHGKRLEEVNIDDVLPEAFPPFETPKSSEEIVDSLALKQAVAKHEQSLPPKKRHQLHRLIAKFSGDLPAHIKVPIRPDREPLRGLRRSILDNGFTRRQRQPKKENVFSHPDELEIAFKRRSHLLSPLAIKVMAAYLEHQRNNGHNGLETTIGLIANETGSTPASVRSTLYTARQVLLHESKDTNRIAFKSRHHRRTVLLERMSGESGLPIKTQFSETDLKIFSLLKLSPNKTTAALAAELRVGTCTVTRALRKLDSATFEDR